MEKTIPFIGTLEGFNISFVELSGDNTIAVLYENGKGRRMEECIHFDNIPFNVLRFLTASKEERQLASTKAISEKLFYYELFEKDQGSKEEKKAHFPMVASKGKSKQARKKSNYIFPLYSKEIDFSFTDIQDQEDSKAASKEEIRISEISFNLYSLECKQEKESFLLLEDSKQDQEKQENDFSFNSIWEEMTASKQARDQARKKAPFEKLLSSFELCLQMAKEEIILANGKKLFPSERLKKHFREERILSFCTLVVYCVLKKVYEKSGNNAILELMYSYFRDIKQLDILKYYSSILPFEMVLDKEGNIQKEEKQESKNFFNAFSSFSESMDIVQSVYLQLFEEISKQAGAGKAFSFKREYIEKELSKKVWIKKEDSIKGIKEVKKLPISEIFRQARRTIENSRGVQSASHKYVYIEDILTAIEKDTKEVFQENIYIRLSKYSQLANVGSNTSLYDDKENIYFQVSESTTKATLKDISDIDRIISSLKLSIAQEKILKLRLSGYGKKAIATYLGVKEGSVQKQISRIREKALAIMTEKGKEKILPILEENRRLVKSCKTGAKKILRAKVLCGIVVVPPFEVLDSNNVFISGKTERQKVSSGKEESLSIGNVASTRERKLFKALSYLVYNRDIFTSSKRGRKSKEEEEKARQQARQLLKEKEEERQLARQQEKEKSFDIQYHSFLNYAFDFSVSIPEYLKILDRLDYMEKMHDQEYKKIFECRKPSLLWEQFKFE